ncbi:ABC transporter ATP-binding protein [Marinomonas sp. CT5]|uniref:ABC transporter ATP-binding protein n=1 Tax=Marinomonas sp. CT5 TaxID=2066133 RepID=UPI001BAF4835|nr:ABC transporter ATP-binding protein [Marinomonas sp. CT5]QUX97721.1 ABC transporter ATP-binding protein [Marinomonas sp. CT5]
MLGVLRQLLSAFSKKERVHLFLLLLLMMATGAVEALGISLIFPFIGIVTDPSIVHENKILNFLYQNLEFSNEKNFIIFIGCALGLFFIFKNFFYIGSQYIQQNYLIRKRVALTGTMFQGYMRSKYEFHLNNNSALLLRNINAVDGVFSGLLQPAFEIMSETIILIGIVFVLFMTDPVISLGAACFIAIPLLILNRFISRKLRMIGKENFRLMGVTSKLLLEGLNGVKEILVMNRQGFYARSFVESSKKLGFIRRDLIICNHVPRLVMEVILILGLISFVIYILVANLSIAQLIPTVSLFGVAAIRMLYSLNKIVVGGNNISFNQTLSATVLEQLHRFDTPSDLESDEHDKNKRLQKIDLDKAIELKNLSFSYLQSEKEALKNISLSIKKGQSVAFVGPSGAGKSSLVDIVLGLLTPSKGEILIDGDSLQNEEVREKWQNSIGYIPQSIYLCDDTLRNNISFGVPADEIDEDAVEQAIEIAQLREVVNNLPNGLDTMMGERGVRLSGGQRQRVAIARALYHNPEIIIMDEATSALDNTTEAEFIEAINRMKKHKTLIIVAHRLTTIKNCDLIFVLQDGEVIGQGGLQELMSGNLPFQRLAQLDPGISEK